MTLQSALLIVGMATAHLKSLGDREWGNMRSEKTHQDPVTWSSDTHYAI